jgi:hypothetical protein
VPDLLNARDVDQGRTVDPDETVLLQSISDVGQAFAHEHGPALRIQPHVYAVRLHPVDRFRIHTQCFASIAHEAWRRG